jgi:hypothetical protein
MPAPIERITDKGLVKEVNLSFFMELFPSNARIGANRNMKREPINVIETEV